MIATQPPVVLIFAPLDPTGSMYLPADAVSCAAVGCHALSIVTATHIQDTTHTELITLSPPEIMYDQMRCLLEDMTVHSIKAGPLYSIDAASVLAQIAADYTELPLVLHLQSIPDESILSNDAETEEIIEAIFQLVLPQAHLVVADHTLLAQWQADGLLPEDEDPIASLLDYGVQSVFYTLPDQDSAYVLHQLHNQDGLQHQWQSPIPSARLQDTEGLLSTLICAYLAQGLSLKKACANAIAYTDRVTTHAFQAGMGPRIIQQTLS